MCSGGDLAVFVDVRTGKQVGPSIRGERNQHVAISPDGRTCLTAGENSVRVWDMEDGTPAAPPLVHEALVEYADFALQGRLIVTASRDHTVRLSDSRTGEPIARPLEHGSFVQQAILTGDGGTS